MELLQVGTTYVGNSVVVKPGDLIYGTMTNTSARNDGHCNRRKQYLTGFRDAQHHQLVARSLTGFLPARWKPMASVLCSQFPSSGPIKFTNIVAYVGSQSVSKSELVDSARLEQGNLCTSAKVVDSKDVNISY